MREIHFGWHSDVAAGTIVSQQEEPRMSMWVAQPLIFLYRKRGGKSHRCLAAFRNIKEDEANPCCKLLATAKEINVISALAGVSFNLTVHISELLGQ